MLLAIDSGNTNIVFGVHDGAEWRAIWRSATKGDRTADELAVWMMQLFDMKGLARRAVDAAVIANVVPSNDFNLRSLCRDHFGVEPLVVGDAGVALGIELLIDAPEEVGADRIANAIGAFAGHGGPLIVIDFGTATTLDVVDEAGNYCGGAIAPSAAHSVDALHRAAEQLPRIDVRRPPAVIGTATVPAMQSGVYWGYVGLIEGLVRRIQEERGAPMKVVATGGLAETFCEATDAIDVQDRDVTLRGLLEVHARNRA
ncbi:MAG: type III pantothenate kinase [Rhodospirillaceae bacterium]|nr:type III pantothenate kinase [Rhodospirillaceae bacterium]